MKATYNITNDKLKFWPAERLPTETYQRARSHGFTFWHGSKCFAAKWTPGGEDFVSELGGIIEDDDTPDDTEARVQRFAGYAERAQGQAESSQNYLDTKANTERRRENAVNGIERGLEQAEHWQRRIEGAIRHAQHREQPDVIARRILGLEADRRREIASFTIKEGVAPHVYEGNTHVFVGGGRGGHWISEDKLAGIKAHAERWIAHLDRRLQYENAVLEASGRSMAGMRPERKKAVVPKGKAKARDGAALEVGGAAGFNSSYGSTKPDVWRIILGVNRTTVDLLNIGRSTDASGATVPTYHKHRDEAYGIITARTAAQVKELMPEEHAHFLKVQAILQRQAERKAAKAQPQQPELSPA